MLKLFVVLLASFGIGLNQEIYKHCSDRNGSEPCLCGNETICYGHECCDQNSEGHKCKMIYKHCSERNGNESCLCGDGSKVCGAYEICEENECEKKFKPCYRGNEYPCFCVGESLCSFTETCELNPEGNKCKSIYKLCSERNEYPCICDDDICIDLALCDLEINKCKKKYCSEKNTFPCYCETTEENGDRSCRQDHICELNPEGNKCKKKYCSENVTDWPCFCENENRTCDRGQICELNPEGNKCKKKYCSENSTDYSDCYCEEDRICNHLYEKCEFNSQGNKCKYEKCSKRNEYPCYCENDSKVCGKYQDCEVNFEGNKCIDAYKRCPDRTWKRMLEPCLCGEDLICFSDEKCVLDKTEGNKCIFEV